MDFSRHLLIDAYNVIHQWPELRRAMQRGSSVAREALTSAVQVLHDRERVRVTLVFDGQGSDIEVERPGQQLTFSCVYTSTSLSADDVIERMVGNAPKPSDYIVVTQDLAERHTIEALGAVALSPDDLRAWIENPGPGGHPAVCRLQFSFRPCRFGLHSETVFPTLHDL